MSAEPKAPNPDRIEALREHSFEKLDLMIRYAQTHRCRRQQILDYFGEATEVDSSTCDCDVCRRERGGIAAAHDATASMSEEVVTLTRKLLAGVARVSMRGQFGVGLIAEVLAGSDTEKTRRWNFENLSVFGLLRVYQVKQIVAMLHRLMEAGMARQRDPDGTKFRPVVELTAAGVAVMKGEQGPPATLSDLIGRRPAPPVRVSVSPQHLPDDSADQLDPEVLARFERLRAVRLGLARERQLPPYCICHDSTLKLIARYSPGTLAALEAIKGMGPNKVRLYGKPLLDALRADVAQPG